MGATTSDRSLPVVGQAGRASAARSSLMRSANQEPLARGAAKVFLIASVAIAASSPQENPDHRNAVNSGDGELGVGRQPPDQPDGCGQA